MKNLAELWKKPQVRALAIVLGLGLLIGIFLRIFWLSYPHAQVFDEVYFPVFAKEYLHHIDVFDVHPPLGKFIIAAGIWLFGDSQIGWRIMPLLFGLLAIWLLGYLWWNHTKDRLGSFLIAFFIAIDGLFVAYSRTGLMDGILFVFMIACVVAMLRVNPKRPLLVVATLIGLTTAIKWVGLAVIIPVGYIAWRKGRLPELLFSLWWSIAVYLVVVGIGEWLDSTTDLLKSIAAWHLQAWHYQLELTATHPWSSPWWSWPLLLRPVLFIYDGGQDGAVQVMTTLGNPLLWWSSTLAVVGSFGRLIYERFWLRKSIVDHPLVLPILGWCAAFLPWALVHRVVFLYHYMPAYGFALIMLAWWFTRWWKKNPWLVVTICGIFLLSFIYFVPLVVGWWPLSPENLSHHILLKSWLY